MRIPRFLFVTFIFLLLVPQLSVAATGKDPNVYFFNETWNDFPEELQKAKDEGKKGIMFFFELDICPFCHRMRRTVLNQPHVQKYFRDNLLIFSIDAEGDVEMIDFDGTAISQNVYSEKVVRVRATPVVMFYDLEGKAVVRYTGPTSGIDEFMWLGEYFIDGHYKKLNFTKFKRLKKNAARQGK